MIIIPVFGIFAKIMRKLVISVGAKNQHSQLVPLIARESCKFSLYKPKQNNLSKILKTFISESNFKTIRI